MEKANVKTRMSFINDTHTPCRLPACASPPPASRSAGSLAPGSSDLQMFSCQPGGGYRGFSLLKQTLGLGAG